MMLNRHFLLALIAVLFTSNVQAAEPTSPINGFYLSPELSAGQQNYSDASITSNSVHRTFSDADDTAMGFGIAAGYDFNKKIEFPLRIELEYMVRGQGEGEWRGSQGIFISGDLDWQVKSKTDLDTLYLNFSYDFHNGSAFTPYLSGGLGFAFIDSQVSYTDGKGNSLGGTNDQSEFSWNIGAGFAYQPNPNWELALAYRYIDAGTQELTPASALNVKVATDVELHEGVLALRYHF